MARGCVSLLLPFKFDAPEVLIPQFAGNITALSLITVPALEQTRSDDGVPAAALARQWLYVYNRGKTQNPPIALVAAGSLGYLAWTSKAGSAIQQGVLRSPVKLYSIAAILTIGIVPYTIVFMAWTNSSIESKAAQAVGKKVGAATGQEDKVVAKLLGKWKILNLG